MSVVLLVDDEASIRRAMREFLGVVGHTVYCAADADEALFILSKEVVDIIVTDIVLPRVSGIQLLQSVREGGSSVPTIVMTGDPTEENKEEANKLGAFAYLQKPISGAIIVRTVKEAENATV